MKKYILVHDNSILLHILSIFSDITTVTINNIPTNGILFVGMKAFSSALLKSGCNIVVMSNNPSFKEGNSLLPLGIKGYINAYMDKVHFSQLLKVVENNRVWLYPDFMQELINKYIGHDTKDKESVEYLTNREKDIAKLVSNGLGNKDIARELTISEGTVKQHLMKVFRKLKVQNRIELALKFKSSIYN